MIFYSIFARLSEYMKQEKLAILDLGTNTFHLLIVGITERGFQEVIREKIAVKIGEGGINRSIITRTAKKRAIQAISQFFRIIKSEEVTQIHAFATSAIRSAANGARLIREISEKTGMEVKIISGIQEAQYIYAGVRQAVELGDSISLIMDIGGGSVEFIIGNTHTVLWKNSFEIGAQRLTDKFHRHDPVRTSDIIRLKKFLEKKLIPLKKAVEKYNPVTLVGSSGTFDTLIEIHQRKSGIERDWNITEHQLMLRDFYEIYNELISRNRDERMAIPGMAEMRVDMIVMSTALTQFILSDFGFSRIKTSTYSLKEGILYSILDSKQVKKLSA